MKPIGMLLCALLWMNAAAVAHRGKPHAESRTDTDYIAALSVANHFLHAWASQDHEAGLMLLTDSARHHESEDRVQAFFSADPGCQQGFEISRGRRIKAGRYRFPVALFEFSSGKKKPAIHRRFSQIIVMRAAAKDDWAVDNVP